MSLTTIAIIIVVLIVAANLVLNLKEKRAQEKKKSDHSAAEKREAPVHLFCKSCGTRLPENIRYCPNCGEKIITEGLKDSRLEKLTEEAQNYLNKNFSEQAEEAKPRVQYQRWDFDDHPRYSLRDPENDNVQSQKWAPDDKPKYSQRDNYDSSSIDRTLKSMSASTPASRILRDLDANTNMSFVDKLLEHISKQHMRDTDVYKAAQIDRRLFSKIVTDREYKPAKDTCVAFALALRLSLSEAEDLLSRAGYVLSHSNKRDVLIEYFFKEHLYDLNDVNEILYRLEQKIIGRCS